GEEEQDREVVGGEDVGGDDGVGGIEVVQRHRDRHHRHEDLGSSREAADRAFFLLDELLGLLPGLLVDDDVLRDRRLGGGRGRHEGWARRAGRSPCWPWSREGRLTCPERGSWGGAVGGVEVKFGSDGANASRSYV